MDVNPCGYGRDYLVDSGQVALLVNQIRQNSAEYNEEAIYEEGYLLRLLVLVQNQNTLVSLDESIEQTLVQWRDLLQLVMTVGVGKFGSSASSSFSSKQHQFVIDLQRQIVDLNQQRVPGNDKKLMRFLYPNYHLKFAGSFLNAYSQKSTMDQLPNAAELMPVFEALHSYLSKLFNLTRLNTEMFLLKQEFINYCLGYLRYCLDLLGGSGGEQAGRQEQGEQRVFSLFRSSLQDWNNVLVASLSRFKQQQDHDPVTILLGYLNFLSVVDSLARIQPIDTLDLVMNERIAEELRASGLQGARAASLNHSELSRQASPNLDVVALLQFVLQE